MAATSPPAAKTQPPAMPDPSPRRLIALAAGLLALCCAGAAISLSQHLPDGATHATAGRQVWHDFIGGGGTAFALGIAIEPITLRVLSAHPDPLKTPLTVLALLAAPATALAAALHLRQRLKARHHRSRAHR